MRRQLLDALDAVPHARFLCYVAGPGDHSGGPPAAADRPADAHGLLREVRDRLRSGPGVNAFLADDVDVRADADAATRSVELARASDAVAVVAPDRGLDARTASVLGDAASDRAERTALVHEADHGSPPAAPLAGSRRVTVHSYADVDDLVFRLRAFVLGVMHREARGDPSPHT